jgi:hypothetical protein
MRAVICGIVTALTATTAAAQSNDMNSANSILPGCYALLQNSTIEPLKQGVCAGTVSATATMLIFGNAVGRSMSIAMGRPLKDVLPLVQPICADIPGPVTVGQEVQVVVRYIEARPNRTHESFQYLVQAALQEAWPCKAMLPTR